jgi:hypothetical protein
MTVHIAHGLESATWTVVFPMIFATSRALMVRSTPSGPARGADPAMVYSPLSSMMIRLTVASSRSSS